MIIVHNDQAVQPILLNDLIGSICWKDLNGVYAGANDAAAKMAGFAYASELIGKTDDDLYPPEIASQLRKHDSMVMASGQEMVFEENIITPEGRVIIQLSLKKPLKGVNGKISGVVSYSSEYLNQIYVELKQAKENAKAAKMATSQFMSIVSHEVKGPLANTLAVLEMIKDQMFIGSRSAKQLNQLIDFNMADVKRGIQTINCLQEFHHLDGEPLPADRYVEINFKKYIKKIIAHYQQIYSSPTLKFQWIKNSKLPTTIKFNCLYIDKIIHLIIKNAIKYSKPDQEGSVTITVKKEKKALNNNYLIFSVKDTGVGIAQPILNHFFEPLLGNDAHINKMHVTPAIKLSYVKRLIEKLDGKLHIQSEVGIGTEVSITFPYQKISLALETSKSIREGAYQNDENKIKQKPTKKLKILAVEDNLLTSKLLRHQLLNLGQRVDTASNSAEASHFMAHQDYDLIFMDISLPGVDGVELKSRCKYRNNRPIVVALTAHNSERDKNYFLAQGFATVITKPFSQKDIQSCLVNTERVLFDSQSCN